MPGLRVDVRPWTAIIVYLILFLALLGLVLTLSFAGAVIWIVLVVVIGAVLYFSGQRILGRAGGTR